MSVRSTGSWKPPGKRNPDFFQCEMDLLFRSLATQEEIAQILDVHQTNVSYMVKQIKKFLLENMGHRT